MNKSREVTKKCCSRKGSVKPLTNLFQCCVNNLVLGGGVVAAVDEEGESRVGGDEGLGRVHHGVHQRRLLGAVGVVKGLLERLQPV